MIGPALLGQIDQPPAARCEPPTRGDVLDEDSAPAMWAVNDLVKPSINFYARHSRSLRLVSGYLQDEAGA
jgi:hypothetical protein